MYNLQMFKLPKSRWADLSQPTNNSSQHLFLPTRISLLPYNFFCYRKLDGEQKLGKWNAREFGFCLGWLFLIWQILHFHLSNLLDYRMLEFPSLVLPPKDNPKFLVEWWPPCIHVSWWSHEDFVPQTKTNSITSSWSIGEKTASSHTNVLNKSWIDHLCGSHKISVSLYCTSTKSV